MGVRGLVTDTWVVSEGGCASAASGDLRSGAPHTISYPILLAPIFNFAEVVHLTTLIHNVNSINWRLISPLSVCF